MRTYSLRDIDIEQLSYVAHRYFGTEVTEKSIESLAHILKNNLLCREKGALLADSGRCKDMQQMQRDKTDN